jgi:DNA-binding response OmpR family regulator
MVPAFHVLVVDPEPATRELVADLLVEAGLEVTDARDQADAERVLSVFHVDVVVGELGASPAPVVALARPIHPVVLLAAIRDAATRVSR